MDINTIDNLVLFDGVCNFCQGSVQFIIKNDKSNSLKFASLQSNFGQQVIEKYKISKDIDSIIFVHQNSVFIKSNAALEIAKYLKFPYKMLIVLKIFPLFWRDKVYDFIAKNRYNWFGKQASCMIPSPEIRTRFLDN